MGAAAVGGLAVGALCALGGLALSFGLSVGGCAVSLSYALGGGAYAGKVAAGGAASAPIAIGDAVKGTLTFQKNLWGAGTPDAVQAAIAAQFPRTPEWLTSLFASMTG